MVKTITIMDDAYESLKGVKNKNESFSDVIRRMISKEKIDLSKWFGVLKGGEKRAEEFEKFVRKTRREVSENFENRLKKLKGE